MRARLLQSATQLTFPDYQRQQQQIQRRTQVSSTSAIPVPPSKVMSSLPLQVLLYFNPYMSLMWLVGMSWLTYVKVIRYLSFNSAALASLLLDNFISTPQ
jgi:hypothetical protein